VSKGYSLPKRDHVVRKLTAILAADVVGYSRMMGADEVGTLRALKAARKDEVDPVIAAHGGRIVKTTGDGLLADFPSVVEAVSCAVNIQRRMAKRNSGIAGDQRIIFRIGVNIGDIIIEDDDIFGDGVNVAARLESICEPGGLCISGSAHDQVHGRLPLAFADGGEQHVKNIARPIRVYALGEQAVADAAELPTNGVRSTKGRPWRIIAASLAIVLLAASAAGWWALRGNLASNAPTTASREVRPSIAVLPLVTLADDGKDDYFADGLTEDVISALGRFSELVVRSRNAVFAYKGKTVPPEEVGRALQVRYVVEGSVRRSPERIRISIRLTDATRSGRLWSETYDVAPKDIFSVQDEITRRIAGTLASRLNNLELAKASTKAPNSLEAYDLVLRGRDLTRQLNRTANSQARTLLKKAIELDASYAPAYVALGRVDLNAVLQGWTGDPQGALQRAESLAQRAITIDSTSAEAHALLGSIYVRYADYDRALYEERRAVELNNSDPVAYAGLATALLWSGDVEGSVKAFDTARSLGLALSPKEAFVLGIAYLLADRDVDAIRTLEGNSPDVFSNAILAAAYAQAGRQADAAAQAETVRRLDPRFDSAEFGSLLRKPDLRAKLAAALGKAGL